MATPRMGAFPPLFMAVGELMINWALLDSMLVKLVAVIYQSAKVEHGEPKVPFEFRRRMRFLRRCVSSSVPALAPFAAQITSLIDEARTLSAIRDVIVHGSLQGYEESEQTYVFVKLDIEGDIHVANTVRLPLATLQGHVLDSQTAMNLATSLTESIMDIFP
jgi:hypothetical protein